MQGHEGGRRGGGHGGFRGAAGRFGGGFDMGWDMHGAHHRGGRSRRMFDGGELRLVMLKLIAATPRHGYELIREIEAMSGGAYVPSPGVIYPTLTLLGELGFIAEEQSDGARKLYAVTEAGTAHLAENAAQADALVARLTALGSERTRTGHAPIRRAMGNLRHALQDRLADASLTDQQVHEVAALLDEAVQKIERIR
jgi:DNA-binding PadR family transcriptional regulator